MAFLKKLHIKWVIKMTDQSQAAFEETRFKQVARWETCFTSKSWKGISIDLILMRSQLFTFIWRKMGLKYFCHWQFIFFPNRYWHHKKWWGFQSRNYEWMSTYKILVKMERIHPEKIRLIRKMRSIWTYSPNS